MNIVSKVINRLELEKCKIEQYRVGKKFDATLEEAYEKLEMFSHNPKASCYRDNKKMIRGGYDLSVIVPVYNTAAYLKRCIDSIVDQNSGYRIQCIIINDGSSDDSEKILSNYKDCDGVTIITQNNKGFSGARNTGLDRIAGRYVMFVDSDDRLATMAIKNLLDVAFQHDADVVAGNYRTVDEAGKLCREYKNYSLQEIKPEGNLYGQPWGKVYKAELFANLRFPEGYWYEDSIFAQIVWPLTKCAYTISEIVYEYTINPKGITIKSLKKPKAVDSLYITEQLLKDRQRFGLTPTEENFAYFLRMVKVTYGRTQRCNGVITKCIFIVQCNLYKYYEGIRHYLLPVCIVQSERHPFGTDGDDPYSKSGGEPVCWCFLR